MGQISKGVMQQNFLYSVEREYETDIDTMWNAWTNAEALESWYFPTVLTSVPGTYMSETHVGGVWAAAVDVAPNDFVAYFWGRYLTVEPRRRLVHTLSYSQDEQDFIERSADAPAHRVEIDFEDRPGRVWVRFAQFGEMPEEQAEASQAGMESYFDSLGDFLAR
jgi:uncharacterized protein YndB with AHSA1/START domain